MTGLFILAWVFVSVADGDTLTLREATTTIHIRLAVMVQ